ncbi:response regulator [Thalassococcus lentus]|uniref:Response regulator n=1 Tax=Thalassococcus lentus TaxID=1210524 RepID=A0ABT4XPC8_9RHOB|nr:response regulator [Thalassococcus lentus]MDA7423804.1 response regulator [Thalassococcus lentus]
MHDLDEFGTIRQPTATRPLLGLTVLVVEDSRFACDAMRLLCLRSGARIRRADCLKSARRHLQVYRPTVVIIDLGLPDGSGADLISELAAACPRVEAILGTSGDPFCEDVSMAAGADGFLAKPIQSVPVFQNAILQALPPGRQPPGPRLVSNDPVIPDPIAYRDDMAHAADVLDDRSDAATLDYVMQFLSGVARSAGDNTLEEAANALAHAKADGRPLSSDLAKVAALVQDRLSDRIAL